HMDMPFGGTTSADDFESGTIAAAFGGTTTIVDFAIQYKGQTLHHAWDTWMKKAEGKAAIDYGFHMIITDLSDQVETVQEWFFGDLDRPDQAAYDCLITIRNLGREPLEEYGQFFASYTAWNEGRGHFFWDEDGTLANFSDRGGTHLDFYVTAKGSPFEKLGRIPHCARGGGKIKAVWRHPALVSQPGPSGHRHVVLCEEARTAGVAQGMSGVAQDYILFPPGGTLRAGEPFSAHVRHLLVKPAADELLAKELEAWWNAFAEDHERVHKLSQAAGE
ncbi:MAG: hypothetical protein WD278_08255, partial [Pirellulales bacterium]